MKPKPFSPLNHFTEPVAIENPLLPWPDLTRIVGGHGRWPLRTRGISKSVMVVPSGGNLSVFPLPCQVLWPGDRGGAGRSEPNDRLPDGPAHRGRNGRLRASYR